MDAFFTSDEDVLYCVRTLEELMRVKESDVCFVEPSAGGGAFLKELTHVIAYDIDPQHPYVKQADFLSLDYESLRGRWVIGNPPFGKKSALAIDFVNRCALFSPLIAFILPIQFLKYGVQAKLPDSLKLIHSSPLPNGTFFEGGQPVTGIRCVFQVWGQGELVEGFDDVRMRSKPPIELPEHFKLWQYNGTAGSAKFLDEDWEYAVYRQGYKDYHCLFTSREDIDSIVAKSPTTQFFLIKPLTTEAEEAVKNFDFNQLALSNTTTPGFGKADFVAAMKDRLM